MTQFGIIHENLKSEEVYLQQYRDQDEARASIQHFIEEVYNRWTVRLARYRGSG